VSIFDKNDDHPCPPSELRKGNPHKRVIHKVPGTGSTGPQFGQKLGRKLKGGMKEVHMKKERTKLVFFSHPPTHPNWSSQEFHTPVWDFWYMRPPLLFIFFTKSSVVRIKYFQNL
jgi:hypothetical protein